MLDAGDIIVLIRILKRIGHCNRAADVLHVEGDEPSCCGWSRKCGGAETDRLE